MDFIISLSHFCELHGPVTVLCTQLAPISCNSCFPLLQTPPPDDLHPKSHSYISAWDPSSPALTPSHNTTGGGLLISPFTSPPTSPRSPGVGSFNPYFGNAGGERTAARRFSIGSDDGKDGCDNCIFVVPKEVGDSVGSSPKEGKLPLQQERSPILRTVQRISANGSSSSGDGHDGDTDEEDLPPIRRNTSNLGSSPMSSQTSTPSDDQHMNLYPPHSSPNHTHSLTYVTRRNPTTQSLYSRLRQSCIRALSNESLPKGSPSGPMLFGDPIAGYTIAYLFRLPDPRARGRRRTYALQALSPDCGRATRAFAQVTRAFETIANDIISLADLVLERESTSLSSRPSTADLLRLGTPPNAGLSASLPNHPPVPGSPQPDGASRSAKSNASSPTGSQRNLADISSFLTAKRVDPDGHPRMSREVMRAKGLAEIVGKDRFFVELHAKFVMILYNLVAGLR